MLATTAWRGPAGASPSSKRTIARANTGSRPRPRIMVESRVSNTKDASPSRSWVKNSVRPPCSTLPITG